MILKNILILFLLISTQAYGMQGTQADPIRSSRIENKSTPFPYNKAWGDILFYEKGQPFYEFTNFYLAPIQLDGKEWPTTEHYFQAQKFPNNPGIREYIRTQCTAGRDAFNAARAARNKHALLPTDQWNAIKWEAIYQAVKAKFSQHANLKKLLLDTGDRVLVENAAPDTYWGIGINSRTGQAGYNNLGIILMKVRDELKAEIEQSDLHSKLNQLQNSLTNLKDQLQNLQSALVSLKNQL